MRFSSTSFLLLLSGFLFFTRSQPNVQEVYESALSTGSRFHVLSLVLKPGFEDFHTLAYLKHVKGASVTSAYLTNGENSESDLVVEYPHERAATLRREAFESMKALGIETFYLNFPDFGLSEDTAFIAASWPRKDLLERLAALIGRAKPDLILIPRDADVQGWSARWGYAVEEILRAIEFQPKNVPPRDAWHVTKVVVDDGLGRGISFPRNAKHAVTGVPVERLAASAAKAYASLRHHPFMTTLRPGAYRIEVSPNRSRSLEADVPPRVARKFRTLDSTIVRLCDDIRRQAVRRVLTERRTAGYVQSVAELIDAVSSEISIPANQTGRDLKILVGWKSGLEELRNALLGVRLSFSVSERLLANRQLTHLTLDSLSGETRGGTTTVYFPNVSHEGWIVDENWNKELPLRMNDPYRLVSPKETEYFLPEAVNGLEKNEYGNSFWFLVIHRAPQWERSFVITARARIFFAPKLTIEPLTPVVRMTEGEELRVRFTNYSRDPFADVMNVRDSLAVGMGERFRLGTKDTLAVATVRLQWREEIEPGNYVIPFRLGDVDVGLFLARKFTAQFDPAKKVGFLSSKENSVLEQSLRRLGVRVVRVAASEAQGLDVLFIDQRVTSLLPPGTLDSAQVMALAAEGCHVVILPQDVDTWNAQSLFPGVVLQPSSRLDNRAPLISDTSHGFLRAPNPLGTDSWDGWLNERAKQTVTVSGNTVSEIPVTTENGEALLVTMGVGNGRITYVALALEKQLLNIHPGSFQLLANLLSY